MRDKLHDYLIQRPAGAKPDELIDIVFCQPGRDPRLASDLIAQLLADDPRFRWCAREESWFAAVHRDLARPLAETTFSVLDLEMTGLEPSRTRIIEIGVAKVRYGRVVEEFQQLVNPDVRLPPFIVGLTGIDDGMLATQPDIETVWPRFCDFIGDSVLVAHNAPFDIGFLNATSSRLSGRELENQQLCTLKLARVLLPEQARRGLEALAAHFGIPLADRHRALGDARVTVEVLFRLLELLAERGIERLDQALEFQNRARDGRPFVSLLPRDKVRGLPEVPGIYRLLDEAGTVLYVGKAKNLRERVGTYLSNAVGHSDKTLDLIRAARDVRVETTGSELEASLAEAAAIRRELPRFNKLDRHLPRIAFLKLNLGDDFPRLSIAKKLTRGRARFIGPFRSAKEAERVAAVLVREFRLRTCTGSLTPDPEFEPCPQFGFGRCTAPCAEVVGKDEYRAQVDAMLENLRGSQPAIESLLSQRVREREQRGQFAGAVYSQRELDVLRNLVRMQRELGWILECNHWVVFERAIDRRMVLAYGVCAGRVAVRARLHDVAELDAFAAAMQAEFETPGVVTSEDIEGTTILAAWMRDYDPRRGNVLPIEVPDELESHLASWRQACAELLNRPTVVE